MRVAVFSATGQVQNELLKEPPTARGPADSGRQWPARAFQVFPNGRWRLSQRLAAAHPAGAGNGRVDVPAARARPSLDAVDELGHEGLSVLLASMSSLGSEAGRPVPDMRAAAPRCVRAACLSAELGGIVSRRPSTAR